MSSHGLKVFGAMSNICQRCLVRMARTLPRGNSTLQRPLITETVRPVSRARRFYATSSDRPTVHSTLDEEELKNFAALAESWWDEEGEFQALHTMNKLRLPFIRDGIVNQRHSPSSTSFLPLEGMKIVDAGSGGGILTEPLARLGATVIGLDAVEESTRIAEAHLLQNPDIQPRVKYINGTVEDLALTEEEQFDAVVASEVVEHVAHLETFLDSCCRLVKPGGSIFITTINKTQLSYGLAVVAAEKVLKITADGTHDWEKFVAPEDLQFLLSKNGFTTRILHGMVYNPLSREWSWIKDTSVNYAVHAVKTVDSSTASREAEDNV